MQAHWQVDQAYGSKLPARSTMGFPCPPRPVGAGPSPEPVAATPPRHAALTLLLPPLTRTCPADSEISRRWPTSVLAARAGGWGAFLHAAAGRAGPGTRRTAWSGSAGLREARWRMICLQIRVEEPAQRCLRAVGACALSPIAHAPTRPPTFNTRRWCRWPRRP